MAPEAQHNEAGLANRWTLLEWVPGLLSNSFSQAGLLLAGEAEFLLRSPVVPQSSTQLTSGSTGRSITLVELPAWSGLGHGRVVL